MMKYFTFFNIVIFISISSLVYFIVNNFFSVNFSILSALLTIAIFFLTAANVYTTYSQYAMANTPVIDGDMIENQTNRCLDLKIINKGPGLATDIEWGLKVEGSDADEYIKKNYDIQNNQEPIVELPVFSNNLYALSRDDRSVLLKDYITPFTKNSDGNKIKYILFLKYKKLMGKNNYYYAKIVFSSDGHKCSHEDISKEEFDTALNDIKEWEKEVKSSNDKPRVIETG